MTYTYNCLKCGEFDIEMSMKDKPLSHCPKCGSEVQRIFKTNVNLVFNGSYNSSRKEG